MKKAKILSTIFVLICTCTFLSAKDVETGDVYEPTATRIPMPKKKKTSGLLDKLFGKRLSDPVLLAESSLFRFNYLGTNVNQEEINIIYYPKEEEVAIAFETKKNRFLRLDNRAQAALKSAFYSYDDAFNAKTLDSRRRRHLTEYGSVKARYNIDPLVGHEEYIPEITFGYVFVNKSPYFIISIPETSSVNENPIDPERTKQSTLVRLLFNRNQMKTLIEQFNEEVIVAALQKAEAEAAEQEEYQGDTTSEDKVSNSSETADKNTETK